MREILVIHYDEIALKRGNRRWFEGRLMEAIQSLFRDAGEVGVRRLYGRLLVHPGRTGLRVSDLVERLRVLPGVHSVLEGVETEDGFDHVLEAVESTLPEGGVRTFGVRARRGDKSYPLRSQEIEQRVGAHVLERRPWKVDLSRPDLWLRIEIVNGRALVCTARHEGPGGLPTGVSGRGVALLSGGIDSPVAAWMMMTRGMRVDCVHFHSAPYTSRASQDKVRELARQLCAFQPAVVLTLIPFADPVQQTIVQHAPQRYRVVLYRRFMMRLAGRAAEDAGASCLITGEALGQVASQTIENLTSVESVAPLPVLRPLIGMGKNQIVRMAERIGTFATSVLPHDDCCSFLMPRRPATRTKPEELDMVERELDVDGLVAAAWDRREREVLRLGGTG